MNKVTAPTMSSIANHFLVAMPGMLSDVFDGGVVYICSHTAEGATGFLINKPTDVSLETLIDTDEALQGTKLADQEVYFGGPVGLNQGFILHEHGPSYQSTHSNNVLAMTSSRDIFDALIQGQGPQQFMVFLGYAGWEGGQLEQELADNCWLTVEANKDIIFNCDFADRYRQALALIGVDPKMLSSQSGHA